MNRLAKESHLVEEINGARCAIIEKNAAHERVEFLKNILEHNGYAVMIAPTPPPPAKKTAAAPNIPEGKGLSELSPSLTDEVSGLLPSTFTIGVTDISFHAMLAVYERSLITPEGKICSVAYWNQEPEKDDELYWMRRKK